MKHGLHLYIALLVVYVVADNAVPLSAMTPTCIRQGKCVNNRGQTDPSVCCSGMCDKDNGCVSSTEATAIWTRVSSAGIPFVCKAYSYFGVRCDKPSYFDSGKISADCLCPENKPCLIGNGDTALCSSRFWIGYCDPEISACIPQLQISVALKKALFGHPKPTANNGLGGECDPAVPDSCDDTANLMCSPTCDVLVGTSITPSSPCPQNGFDVSTPMPRDLGDVANVCKYTAGAAVGLNEPCLCDSDCSQGQCIVLLGNNLHGLVNAQDDTSLLGECLIPPGQTTCNIDCNCPPGSECDGGGACTIPAGSALLCASASCTPPATCNNSNLCKLGAGEKCVENVQCDSGNCHILTGTCTGCAVNDADACSGTDILEGGACVPLPSWISDPSRNIPSTLPLPWMVSDDTSDPLKVDTVAGTGLDVFCGTSLTSTAIVYRWRVPFSGIYTLTTCEISFFYDTKVQKSQLSVFAANDGGVPVCIDGNDDFGCSNFLQSGVVATLTECETVYIVVHGFSSGMGPFTLTVQLEALTCVVNADCPTGSICDGGTCTIPAGSTQSCASATCTPPATCSSSNLCKLGIGEDCTDSQQCQALCDPGTSNGTDIFEAGSCLSLPAWIPVATAGDRNVPSTTALPWTKAGDTSGPDAVVLDGTGLHTFCGTSYTAGSGAIVYRWRIPTPGTYTFSTCNAASYDTKITVFAANGGGTPVCIAGQDDAFGCSGFSTELTVGGLIECETVYIVVHGFSGATGSFTLTVSM